MLKQALLVVPLLLVCHLLGGQNFFFRQYTTSDGLPSNTVFTCDQDSRQILWIGTGNGICEFDGANFRNYAIEDGLVNNVVYGLTVDHLDRKWMSTLANKPSFFWKGKGDVPHWGDSLQIGNYFFQSIDTFLWFSGTNINSQNQAKTRMLAHVQSNGELKVFPSIKVDLASKGVRIGDAIYFTGTGILYKYQHDQFAVVENFQLPPRLEYCQAFNDGLICIQRGRAAPDQIVFIDIKQQSIIYLDQLKDHLINKTANALLIDEKKQIWVGLSAGLLFLDGIESKPNFLLPNVFVNELFQDHESNLWLSTEGKGLFFLISNSVRSLREINEQEDMIIRALETDEDGRIYVGYSNGLLEVYGPDFNLQFSKKCSMNRIVDILIDQEEAWVATNNEIIKMDKAGNQLAFYKSKFPIKSIGLLAGQLYIFSYKIEILANDEIGDVGIPFNSRIYSNYAIDDTTMLLGTTDGLYRFSQMGVTKMAAEDIYSDVRGIEKDSQGRYWVATGGQGLFILERDSVIYHLTKATGLSSNICMHLLLDKETAWVSTNQGINKIDLHSLGIQLIHEQDGLSSGEIKYLKKSNQYVIAAASGGVDIIPDTVAPFTGPPQLQINQFVVNGDTMPLEKNYVFSYLQHNLSLSFTGISFKSMGKVSYAYQLEGLDRDWLETSANTLNWSAVPPGNYKLRLKTKGSNAKWSPETQIAIFIDAPWWQKWWAKWLLFLLVSVGLTIIYKRMQAYYQGQNALQKQLQTLQLTALRAQMNPHFMFNALSSIQEFINNSDLKAANLYLSRFASLVRSILNNSTQERISLEEEISQLKLYLTLENLRFRQQLNYDIQVASSVQPSGVFIPTMIIQPFLENAIIHGLFHQKGEKKLLLKFMLQGDDLLHCQIQDNGIGRKRATEINQKKKHKAASKGIHVTQNRLNLINKSNPKQITLEMIDLVNAEGASEGTLVHLWIPFSTEKENYDSRNYR